MIKHSFICIEVVVFSMCTYLCVCVCVCVCENNQEEVIMRDLIIMLCLQLDALHSVILACKSCQSLLLV